MELFRSLDMKYVSITMTNESSHDTIKQLGKFGKFHIINLSSNNNNSNNNNSNNNNNNNNNNNKYESKLDESTALKQQNLYKKRMADCIYWEKKLIQFEDEMKRRSIIIPDIDDCDNNNNINTGADVLESVYQWIDPIEKELVLSVQFQRENQRLINEQKEKKYCLIIANRFKLLPSNININNNNNNNNGLIEFGGVSEKEEKKNDGIDIIDTNKDEFRYTLFGVIPVQQQLLFNRMIYRLSRGNAFAKFYDINELLIDNNTGDAVKKSVFYVVVIGKTMKSRVEKLCDSCRATLYNITTPPISPITVIDRDIEDKSHVNHKTNETIALLLEKLAWDSDHRICPIRQWRNAIIEEREICSIFMQAHYYLTMIALEGWIPSDDIKGLKQAIKQAVAGTGNPPAALEIDPSNPINLPGAPPTSFPTNKFTECFQGIVDTYGVPRYKEINPGLFTIISFPFLFGVMYGDIGHGLFLLLFSYMMVKYETTIATKLRKGEIGEIIGMAFSGRYLLLLMSCFAIYCGFIYNDCFSIPWNLWGTRYDITLPSTTITNSTGFNITLPATEYDFKWDGSVYPIGIDPAWGHTTNQLAFFNSFKMKMSVILGVVQMSFGIILSLFNHLYFQDKISIYFEFLPRIIFMMATFGYMDFLILYKWCQNYENHTSDAPNLIQTMIGMFLGQPLIQPLYSGQAGFQTFLLLCALLSVPVMLFAKPIIKHKLQQQSHQIIDATTIHNNGHEDIELKLSSGDELKLSLSEQDLSHGDDNNNNNNHGGGDDHHSLSDELIHNAIHTIEFVLGTVSNTASYLRLWALSLAHAELSDVFWEKMIMQYGLLSGSGLGAVIGFGIWFGATFAVLLSMDVLECFLHALRLHWVEFQNKFYYADGKPFEPFTFQGKLDQ